MGPWGPPLIPSLDRFPPLFHPPFPSSSCQLVSCTTSTSRPSDIHADSHDSMLMFLEDKSAGHLWPKWQLHSLCTHMSKTVEILKPFQGLLETHRGPVSQSPGLSVSLPLAPCHEVHYLALNLKCASLNSSWSRFFITTKASIFIFYSLYLILSILPFHLFLPKLSS